jgi:hypothetical protein
MYELAIEYHHSGLSLSVHPDRGDAADALGAYSSTVDGFPRVLQADRPPLQLRIHRPRRRARHRYRHHRTPRSRPNR